MCVKLIKTLKLLLEIYISSQAQGVFSFAHLIISQTRGFTVTVILKIIDPSREKFLSYSKFHCHFSPSNLYPR